MEGWFLGCPPDFFSLDGQAWRTAILDPEKTFNEDGSLSDGGKLLKSLYKKMFKENQVESRIDHLVGLIDPWVYKRGALPKSKKVQEDYSLLLASWTFKICYRNYQWPQSRIKEPDKNTASNSKQKTKSKYGMLIEKIVIAAAKEEVFLKMKLFAKTWAQ